jgi:peptidoglycan-associated lipoprotein
MMKRCLMMLVAALAVALAGCSSGGSGSNGGRMNPQISLHPPIGVTETPQPTTTVQPVQASNVDDNAQGPVGVGRVILFDFDSYVIKPEYQSLIEQHARFLQDGRGRSVSLEGHADERGSREYNLALGQKRAEAVRRALLLAGANDAQLEAVSFGMERPAVEGHNEAAWAQNRRVELRYKR